ncbi:PocR sensory domain-containing protein [Lachnospiraceae bacterium]|nr:PocR sensory domain-containing protein [Lachnospiraceae bacterium]
MKLKLGDFLAKEDSGFVTGDYAKATGLAVAYLDAAGNIYGEVSGIPREISSYLPSHKGVNEADVDDSEVPVKFDFLDMGLTCYRENVFVRGEKVITVVCGLARTDDTDGKVRDAAAKLRVSADDYEAAVKRLPIVKDETVRIATDFLAKMTHHVMNGIYFGRINDSVVNVVKPEVEQSADAVADIAGRAKKLESIASRQNILTLNASIEAARAGAVGAGFAVVAHQMGEMSKDSAVIYGDIEKDAYSLRDSMKKIRDVLENMD